MEDGRDSAGKWNKADMNDLAGRLNETLGRLFICLCMIRDTANPENVSCSINTTNLLWPINTCCFCRGGKTIGTINLFSL